jgi:hypothetical protein
VGKGLRRPTHGGDEGGGGGGGGERGEEEKRELLLEQLGGGRGGGGGGDWGHGQDADELHGARIDDHNTASSAVSEQCTAGATVGVTAIAPARRTWQDAIPHRRPASPRHCSINRLINLRFFFYFRWFICRSDFIISSSHVFSLLRL